MLEYSCYTDSMAKLFDEYRGEAFTYIADVQLFRILCDSKLCKVFVAEAGGRLVGCIYVMKYMYDCGWIGGLFVRREFRKRGIGRRLLEKAIDSLKTSYIYAYVESENATARRLFEKLGFKVVYKRINCTSRCASMSMDKRLYDCGVVYDVEWEDLTEATGFKERDSIVNLGYYPVKMTKGVFKDLRRKKHILKCEDTVAAIEYSYVIKADEHTFTLNDYIIGRTSISPRRKVIEVNPFYIKPSAGDLVKMLKFLAARADIMLWTYEEDPIIDELPLTKYRGALVMELRQGDSIGYA